MPNTDVIIIGAGAAGMMCAIEAGKRGRSVVLLDHAKHPGEKIRISGGGRCNFTNVNCKANNFISGNPHFVKSALAQYSAADFMTLVKRYNIAWHEKTLGQMFCDNRSTDILNMLFEELSIAGVQLLANTEITGISHDNGQYFVETDNGTHAANSLVIATGGKSIPKMGATGFGYKTAEQFGIKSTTTRPALVPFTFDQDRLKSFVKMAGTAFNCRVTLGKIGFEEAALFTHRGLSGPAMLQISSYWREGDEISICFLDAPLLPQKLAEARSKSGKLEIQNWLANFLPQNLAKFLCEEAKVSGKLGDMSKRDIENLTNVTRQWRIVPAGSEGYRTAEVTLGGIDTGELNSRTMEAKKVSGLYFIGEVVDVTGWLGGYNFQWAWSSGWAAGQVV